VPPLFANTASEALVHPRPPARSPPDSRSSLWRGTRPPNRGGSEQQHAPPPCPGTPAHNVSRPPSTTALMTQWINYGSAAQSLSGVKAESPARQRMAASTLAGATRSYASQGVHVWHTPPSYWRALDLAAAARGAGRVVALSEACCVADNPPVGICNSLGGCSSQYGSRQLSESFPSYSLRSLPRIARWLSRGAAVMPSSGVGSITGPLAASDGEQYV